MNRQETWNEFLDCLQEAACKQYQSTQEYTLRQAIQKDLDEMLSCELMESQKTFIEEIISELLSLQAQEADLLYRQGVKDGIWLLKSLGVLA